MDADAEAGARPGDELAETVEVVRAGAGALFRSVLPWRDNTLRRVFDFDLKDKTIKIGYKC